MDLNNSLILFPIEKEEVLQLQFRRAEKLLKALKKRGKYARGTLTILFNGYDDIKDEVYEIPEVRKWASKFVKRNPGVFYFLSKEMEGDHVMLTMICETVVLDKDAPTKSPDDYAREGVDPRNLPKVLTSIGLPEGVREYITQAVYAHGKKVNDLEGARTAMALFEIFDR